MALSVSKTSISWFYLLSNIYLNCDTSQVNSQVTLNWGEIMAPSTSRTSIYVGFDYFPTEFFFNFNWHSISFFHTNTIQVKWPLKWTWNVSRGVFTYCHIYGLLGLPIRIFSYWVMCTFAYHILGLCVHFTYHIIWLCVHSTFHVNILQ